MRTQDYKLPIIDSKQLGHMSWGSDKLSVYRGIIILWDDDFDERVIQLLDTYYPEGSVKPLAIAERKACVSLLWEHELHGVKPEDYCLEEAEGVDTWIAEHRVKDTYPVEGFRRRY